jgi:acyl carrier protein
VVYLGDVRSLPHLGAFRMAVGLAQARDIEELRERVEREVREEEELCIDARWFARLPLVTHAEVMLKRGCHRNEMSEYRYDVELWTERDVGWVEEGERLSWSELGDEATLWARVSDGRASVVEVRGIPNARVAGAQWAYEQLTGRAGACPPPLSDLRTAAAQVPGVDPESLWERGEREGHGVRVRWSSEHPGRMDLLVERGGRTRRAWRNASVTSTRGLASQPLRGRLEKRLIPRMRAWVAARLPEAMQPHAWVLMEELPRSPSGKVDRRALPAPHATRSGLAQEYLAPRTEVEEKLAELWRDLLKVDRVGIEDGFFELGGHSLLATQVISRVRDLFGAEVALRALFEKPTVAGLADEVEAALTGGRRAVPAVEPVPRSGELPLSFAQQRLWFLDRLEPEAVRTTCRSATGSRGSWTQGHCARRSPRWQRRHEAAHDVRGDGGTRGR